MRDRRFVAVHRGGTLKKEQHIQLMLWAVLCTKNVFPLLDGKPDERLIHVLSIAEEWTKGNASVGDARKAALMALAVANESTDPVLTAVARAAGHTVATAHMADHSVGGALYALKALKSAGKPIAPERDWQNDQLPKEIRELVLETRFQKEQGFKDLRSNLPESK